MKNCILAGVGGQGTVLASKLIAQCAMERGEFVRTAETIGMAQRGGCVVSHVRVGKDAYSPLLPLGSADLLIAFEPAEAVRTLPYLKKGGTVVVSTSPVQPVTVSLSGKSYDASAMLAYLRQSCEKVVGVDTAGICKECGSQKVANVALLGAAAASGALGVTPEELESAITRRLPEKFLEMNRRALYAGAKAAE
ncbi:MAG: indolepyruvate oxidoreductase subunit beta [Candidatus Merdivicinus sp.]|jgi:indolepyruvate ferredoxin oxidoreductase beta subunit